MPADGATMDERGLVLLRRKLEALAYTEPLEPGSAALVGRLVADLIRTTDSYRSVKAQAAAAAQEVAGCNTKVRRRRGAAQRAAARGESALLPLLLLLGHTPLRN